MSDQPMMMCGHSANATRGDAGEPVCVICLGIVPGADVVNREPPDLTGRRARCSYYGSKCTTEIDSNPNSAFFEHKPDEKFDQYYCGCWGWD